MTNRKRYQNIFCTVFGVESEQLDGNFSFQGVKEWDSIAHMNLITSLEEEFDILLEMEEILNFGSYDNGIQILAGHGVDFKC